MSDIGVSDAATVSIALNILRRSSSRQHLPSGAVCADVDGGSRLHAEAVTQLLGYDDSAHRVDGRFHWDHGTSGFPARSDTCQLQVNDRSRDLSHAGDSIRQGYVRCTAAAPPVELGRIA